MKRLPRLALWICAALPTSASTHAQLVPVDGRAPIPVTSQRIRALVEDGLARTRLRQTFVNPHARPLEAVYELRLPAGASLVELVLEVGGERLEGLLAERQRARRVYDEVVRAERDPALVEQIAADLFRLSVFPVLPNQPTVVELAWIQPLPLERGAFRYSCPLAPGDPLPAELAVDVTLRSAVPFTRVQASRADAQVVLRSAHEAQVSLEARGEDVAGELSISAAIEPAEAQLAVRSYRAREGAGWFLALVTPPPVREDQLVPRDVVLVLDTSGSMSGERKLEHAKRAALWLLRNLRAADRVNVLRFSSDVEAFAAEPVEATPEELTRLAAFVQGFEARGSTALGDALAAALAGEPAPGRARTVVLLTDGRPTVGECDPAKLIGLARAAEGLRLFPFGVGRDVDAGLLRGLAAAGRGRAELFLPGSEIEQRLTAFLARTASPVITDLSLEIEGVAVHDVLPRPLPDLFLGEQLAITGRYRDGGRARFTVRGLLGGAPCALSAEVDLPAAASGSRSVMELHARAKLAHLEEARRLRLGLADDAYYAALDRGAYSTADEIVQEMVDVSLESGVHCAYTAFIALLPEDRARLDPREREELEAAGRRARRLVGGEASEEFLEPVLRDEDIADQDEASASEGGPGFICASPFDDPEFNDAIGLGGGASRLFLGRFGDRRGPLARGQLGTTEALRDALASIAARQGEDGSWGGDVGETGLALLALLGDGHTTRAGLHRAAVSAGVRWLRERQDLESGRIGSADPRAHALATLVLAEAYACSRSPLIRGSLQRALDCVQRELAGSTERAAEVLGWSLLALQAGREAGLPLDPGVEARALERLDALASSGDLLGVAVRAACLLSSGAPGHADAAATDGAAQLAAAEPLALEPEALFWSSLAAFLLGGDTWREWNARAEPALLGDARARGSGVWRVLTLEVCSGGLRSTR